MESKTRDISEPRFVISGDGWRIIAAGAAVVTAASLGGLVAVLALGESDALATTALVLAILSFIVQMLIAVQQTRAMSQAEVENRKLNHQTGTLLEKIQASSEASERVLVKQFENLLDFVTSGRSAVPKDEGETDIDSPHSEALIPPERWQWAARSPSAEDQRVIDEMQSWSPVDTTQERMEVLRKLPPPAIAMLERYKKDEIQSRKDGTRVGLHSSKSACTEANYRVLREAGLTVERGDDRMGRLTPYGRQVAALLSCVGAPKEVARTVYDWMSDADEAE